MRKARFTEHQIIAVIKSVEAGRTVKDVCREAGISEATYYNWKSKYGGMEASDIKKIKDFLNHNGDMHSRRGISFLNHVFNGIFIFFRL